MPELQSNNPDHPLLPQISQALATVNDPEIKRPITDLKMVEHVNIDDANRVHVKVLLTVSGCPMRGPITRDVTAAVQAVPGVREVEVELGVMTDEQRNELRNSLSGGASQREIPFARADSMTRVLAVASGKGGVGKSSLTVNLAKALAEQGRSVGVLDADIYGHSVPAMLGLADARPTSLGDDNEAMILPVPSDGLMVMSIGMMKPSRDQVVAWRGPILDRALQQMLADVYWGDLDYLVVDLPPGTGDVAMSIGQKLPNAEIIVVTTPQQAAAEVAERAGTMASMMKQRVLGVIENMAFLETECPHCHETHRVDVFGTGGGQEVSKTLTKRLGYEVPLLAQVPLDPNLRAAGDEGVPVVAMNQGTASARAISRLAEQIGAKGRSLTGRRLNLTPTRK